MSSINKLSQGDEDNPLPIKKIVEYDTDSVIILNKISQKLDILIKYQAMLHGIELTE